MEFLYIDWLGIELGMDSRLVLSYLFPRSDKGEYSFNVHRLLWEQDVSRRVLDTKNVQLTLYGEFHPLA